MVMWLLFDNYIFQRDECGAAALVDLDADPPCPWTLAPAPHVEAVLPDLDNRTTGARLYEYWF